MPLGIFTRDLASPVEDVELRPRAIVCRCGSNELDRLMTVVMPSGMDLGPFNRSGGPVLWSHGHESRGTVPIGKAQARYRPPPDDDIVARVVFRDDEFSRELFSCYASGDLTGWSIRAIPRQQACGPPSYEEIRRRPELERCQTVFRASELCEVSAVAIPGCRSAVTLMIERGLWSPAQARAYTATHKIPDRAPSAPARAAGPDGGLRLEFSDQQWKVLDHGDHVSAAYRDDAGALLRAGKLLRSMALTGAFRSAPSAAPGIEYDPVGDRWVVRSAAGILGAYSAGLDNALDQAARRLRTAGGAP
jgi:hypothetical protein